MIVKYFEFNPFSENTYVLYDETKECIIVDPGCYNKQENDILSQFIEEEKLTPVKLVLTHGHIDHIFGNAFVHEKYGLPPEAHMQTRELLRLAGQMAHLYGLNYVESPEIAVELEEGGTITFGNTQLDIIWVPGHSPDSICLLNHKEKVAVVGDVLFRGSIGRTDLPGGDYNILITGIKEKLLSLPDDWIIYNGHGPNTVIGHERRTNPFLQD